MGSSFIFTIWEAADMIPHVSQEVTKETKKHFKRKKRQQIQGLLGHFHYMNVVKPPLNCPQ